MKIESTYKGYEIVLGDTYSSNELYDVYKDGKLVLWRLYKDACIKLIDNGEADKEFNKIKLDKHEVIDNVVVTNYSKNLYTNLRLYFIKLLGENVNIEATLCRSSGITDLKINQQNYRIVTE